MTLRLTSISYLDDSHRSLIKRVPPDGLVELKPGIELNVAEHQLALFVVDGEVVDQLGAGEYTISQACLPGLLPDPNTTCAGAVYFVSCLEFPFVKWSTAKPMTMEDPKYGTVKLRSVGKSALKLLDAELLIKKLAEDKQLRSTDRALSFVEQLIGEVLNEVVLAVGGDVRQLQQNFDEIHATTMDAVRLRLADLGLELTDFVVNSIHLPPAIQQEIEQDAKNSGYHDLESFTVTQAAQSMSRLVKRTASRDSKEPGSPISVLIPDVIQQAIDGASLDELKATSVRSESGFSQLIRDVAQSAGWELQSIGSDWQVTVSTGPLRRQRVHIQTGECDQDGNRLVSFTSTCGPAAAASADSLLRENMNLVHGGYAIKETPSGEMVVVRANYLADTVDMLEITRVITAIAWQADRMESALIGEDEF